MIDVFNLNAGAIAVVAILVALLIGYWQLRKKDNQSSGISAEQLLHLITGSKQATAGGKARSQPLATPARFASKINAKLILRTWLLPLACCGFTAWRD